MNLTASHLRIPEAVASQFAAKGVPDIEEIESVARFGLAMGALEFDPARDPRCALGKEEEAFDSYLVRRARWKVLVYLKERNRAYDKGIITFSLGRPLPDDGCPRDFIDSREPPADYDEDETLKGLRKRALALLPTRWRNTFSLLLDGLTPREIAGRQRVSRQEIHKRIMKCRVLLMKQRDEWM
jgi:DNA-directed RNA polymerase specialized sigma24 family protein